MKKQIFNPYMPSWEYVPDGEPHVFGDRVYVYGSHDIFNGWVFCLGDYICYSAPVDDLTDWRYEGVIYPKTSDPLNKDGKMNMFAPDVTQGPDGRYYLYYVLDMEDIVSVAVCDTPAGEYRFYGYVHHSDGTYYGRKVGANPQFDPGVMTEGDKTYLYTGFGRHRGHGAMATVLDKDMLTIIQEPKYIVPSISYDGTELSLEEYKSHEFFEASSIRKFNGKYYFIYSSDVCHELCYAVSDTPTENFKYGGILISNADVNIDTYKPADVKMRHSGNNHGSVEFINGEYYIFYHRQTNKTSYSRQGCAEKIIMNADGSFTQAEISSCGLNGGPLVGKGFYPAHIACYVFSGDYNPNHFPKITQDGKDGDEILGHVADITNGCTVGFKNFEFDGTTSEIKILIRGYGVGEFEVRTELGGEILATIPTRRANIWEEASSSINIPACVHSLVFTYKGVASTSIHGFELI
ncbi:MAG: family 43 glycosylhydrolase [Clostridia bacterium]|nr:family 43 glycosylhydrolase [Clostridia bacterium]